MAIEFIIEQVQVVAATIFLMPVIFCNAATLSTHSEEREASELLYSEFGTMDDTCLGNSQ